MKEMKMKMKNETDRFVKKKAYNNGRNEKKDKKFFRKMKTEDEFDGNAAKRKKNVKNKKVKKEESSEEDEDNEKNENNVNNEKKNINIDFRLRKLLFRKKKPVVQRNGSVGRRKKIGFSLD